MVLNLYIARRFLGMLLRVLGVFYGILLLIDTIDQLRLVTDRGAGVGTALRLAALNVPESLYRIFPLIVVLSAIALFIGLARSSELVVVRAAGRSGLRFLMAPAGTALLVGLFAVSVLNPLVAATTRAFDVAQAEVARGGKSVLSVSGAGLWLRQGGDEGQTVIQAARSSSDATQLYDATFLRFDAEGMPTERIGAKSATLVPGAWKLDGAKRWDLTAPNPEMSATQEPDGFLLTSDLTREGIRDSFGKPSAIPFWSLPDYIDGLERAGFSARSHEVWFQMELAQPLLLIAMVLIAAGFTMRHARFGKTGTLVLLAVLSGFAIFFLRNFAQVLGENGQIPVLLAAWSPPLAAVMMALGLLLHLEDG
ncbi:LPS export ABC transporter permease LptG [Paragemmobacter straminiformis]|uniref:LPS export ABC transporter permease LptG n=1 Tax=Paragemmobacter straminiformis TaxID=2045119 RepID=A0A842I8J2_9RHOB|nr:LPS export ABC transporter permease LptG [Gemmobacter straminiformis]MBC2835394.1 LPS export ABC transporter permease LptG [Gemmobacter straminiformis]